MYTSLCGAHNIQVCVESVWIPLLGEELFLKAEGGNEHDQYATAQCIIVLPLNVDCAAMPTLSTWHLFEAWRLLPVLGNVHPASK